MFATAPNFARTAVAALGTVLFAGVCLMGATAPAAAATAPSAMVHYHDLNLASVNGRETLDSRIALAARRVCTTSDRDLKALTARKACVDTAVNNARRQAYVVTASSN